MLPTVHETTGSAVSATLIERVVASFDASADPRFRDVMQTLVRHLHAFAAEVELSEDEWFAAIEFLTRTGHITGDERQEFVLLSDVLGLSMLTVGINGSEGTLATEPTVFGPFFVDRSPHVELGGDLAQGASGEPCWVSCAVVDTAGEAVAGARVEIWQADADGLYDVQRDGLEHAQGRGHVFAADDGSFRFWTVRPVAYPVPQDGPVGDLLGRAGRSAMRPAHIHFMISAEGCRRLITHVFDSQDDYLETDAVFGVKPSLIADFVRHEPGAAPDGRVLEVPWYELSYRFTVERSRGATPAAGTEA
jgi:hydroxyquinol 1,2-dioxygenase